MIMDQDKGWEAMRGDEDSLPNEKYLYWRLLFLNNEY